MVASLNQLVHALIKETLLEVARVMRTRNPKIIKG